MKTVRFTGKGVSAPDFRKLKLSTNPFRFQQNRPDLLHLRFEIISRVYLGWIFSALNSNPCDFSLPKGMFVPTKRKFLAKDSLLSHFAA
jgi:hypothetical protein